jgi:hypothetical protein
MPEPILPDPADAPRDNDWAVAYCRDALGILLSDPDFAAVRDEVLSRLGVSRGFALQACEMLDDDYPNLTTDDDQRWCDECGEGISPAEYLSGQGLCISCIRAVN